MPIALRKVAYRLHKWHLHSLSPAEPLLSAARLQQERYSSDERPAIVGRGWRWGICRAIQKSMTAY